MVALVALFVPSSATAATVVDGDFESGTLNGWHVQQSTGTGDWFAYSGTAAPIGSKRPKPADPVQAPPQGSFAATTDEFNPDTLILYQDVALEPGFSHRLSLLAYYDSYKPIAIPTPDTLSVDDEALPGPGGMVQGNQQFRIDVMKPSAPLESLDPTDILRTVFRTKRGDPEELPPTRMTADLSAFAGQTVRLRIAVAAHDEVLNAGVDAVSISSTPGLPSSRGSKNRPVLFSFGRVKLNKDDGTATLRMHVSGPGLLSARDASSVVRTSMTGKGPRSHGLIWPATVGATAARTVTIRLRPTSSALETLRRKHKLRVKVGVVFFPENTPSEAATVPVTLRLVARPRHR